MAQDSRCYGTGTSRFRSFRVTIEGESVLLGGDVVLEVLGIPILDEAALEKVPVAMARLSTGDLLTVKVLRGGKVMELSSRIPSPDRR